MKSPLRSRSVWAPVVALVAGVVATKLGLPVEAVAAALAPLLAGAIAWFRQQDRSAALERTLEDRVRRLAVCEDSQALADTIAVTGVQSVTREMLDAWSARIRANARAAVR